MTSLHADEALLTYYQFSHDPFAPRTPGFRFFPAQRKPVLGQLHHLARYSRLLLVVSGPLGSGKTLLRQALVASSNKQTVLCVVVSARASARIDGLLRQIALGLDLAHADERSILARVEQLAAAGQEVYLLVDDAELLEAAALEALLVLAAGAAVARPRVFLFGEPELMTRLQALTDGEERFHVLRLNPYTLDDTREYLAQRLEGAGSDLGLFSEEQIEAIHHDSGGWPGEINRLALELLHEGMRFGYEEDDGEGAPGPTLPKKHLLALAVVALAVAGGAWLLRGGSEGEHPAGPSPAPVAGPAGAISPPSSLAAGSQPVLREPLAQAAGEADVEDIGVAGSAAVLAATSAAALAASSSSAGLAGLPASALATKPEVRSLATGQSSSVALPPPVTARSVEIPAQASAPRPATKPAPARTTPPPAPQAVAKPAPAPAKPPLQSAPAPQVVAKLQSSPASAPRALAKPPAQVVTKPQSPSAPVSQSVARSTSRYALQVLGTRSENSAQSFVRAQGAGYRYFRKQHEGQPLFVVVYGNFASREEALAAIKRLPAAVQAGKPWPRPLSSIH